MQYQGSWQGCEADLRSRLYILQDVRQGVPAKAVALEDSVVKIDHEKCIEFGPECGMICIEKCPRDIFRSYLEGEDSVQQTAVAGGLI